MSLKQASFLAFLGTMLLAILLVVDLVLDVLSLARGLIAAVTLLTSVIRAFAAVSVAVCFRVMPAASVPPVLLMATTITPALLEESTLA